jgi:WD40 repeat protein
VPHAAAIRALACTGPDAQRNLALIGAWDGSVHVLDLDDLTKPTQPLAGRHNKPVNCLAFSPDGTICASGGDDHDIYLWSTTDGRLLSHYRSAHRAPVTSLQFASADLLISAGDSRLLAWDIKDPANPKLARELFDRRSGSVTKLGLSPDGSHCLVDYGNELRRYSLATRQIEGVISNSNEALTFSDLALFSPDGLCVLTNGPGEGRLQLWRTPTAASRAEELRQLIWTQGAATCGAFAPDSSLAVTGTRDNQVLLWHMPRREKDASGRLQLAEPPLQATVTLVDKTLDSTTRQVRVWAELVNPGWLTPGSTATLVIPTK